MRLHRVHGVGRRRPSQRCGASNRRTSLHGFGSPGQIVEEFSTKALTQAFHAFSTLSVQHPCALSFKSKKNAHAAAVMFDCGRRSFVRICRWARNTAAPRRANLERATRQSVNPQRAIRRRLAAPSTLAARTTAGHGPGGSKVVAKGKRERHRSDRPIRQGNQTTGVTSSTSMEGGGVISGNLPSA